MEQESKSACALARSNLRLISGFEPDYVLRSNRFSQRPLCHDHSDSEQKANSAILALYPLSYRNFLRLRAGFEPATSRLQVEVTELYSVTIIMIIVGMS